MLWYLLESPRRVNKGKKKGFLSFIILIHVGILYSGKFLLTVESWRANAVVITRALCIIRTVTSLIEH